MTLHERVRALLYDLPPGQMVDARFIKRTLGLSEAVTTKVLKELREQGLVQYEARPKSMRKSFKPGSPAAPWHYALTPAQRAVLTRQRRAEA